MASASDAQNVEVAQNREGDAGGRTRSRSRGRGGEENEDVPKVDQIPLGSLNEEDKAPEDHRETMVDEGEGLPGAPATPPKGASRYELMQEIISCGKTIAAANEDLTLVMDELKDTKKDLAAGFKILGDQLTATTHAISTMSGAVSHQSSEVSKLLKAFDRHAGAIRWALKGDYTLEQSIQGVTTEITNRAGQLESRIGLAFENLSRGLQQLIQTLQDQPSAVTALGNASSRFPPPFPLSTGGTARSAAPLTPAIWGPLEFQCRRRCHLRRQRRNPNSRCHPLLDSCHCARESKGHHLRTTQVLRLRERAHLCLLETMCLEAKGRYLRQYTVKAKFQPWHRRGARQGLQPSTTAKEKVVASINRCQWNGLKPDCREKMTGKPTPESWEGRAGLCHVVAIGVSSIERFLCEVWMTTRIVRPSEPGSRFT